ncbi:hypothetical protein HanPI659440_Chr03g0134741 [Helianthus annuus]|nr:hypothetical protein HanPI659440_Chr03g0134741 [Helianthus annuus]
MIYLQLVGCLLHETRSGENAQKCENGENASWPTRGAGHDQGPRGFLSF